VYPQELEQWRAERHAGPGRARGGAGQPAADPAGPRRIKELERELRRKDRALAETAALLVLSKKVAAIFNKGEDE
jgi:transposase